MRATVLLVLSMSAQALQAQSWNLAADFSSTGNPSGAWSYGWKTSTSGQFNLFDRSFQVTPVMPGWTSLVFPSSSPLVALNPTGNPQSVPGTGIVAPPFSAWVQTGPGGELPVVRWTAPFDCNYTISAAFQKIDASNTATHQLYVLIGGGEAFNQQSNCQGLPVSTPNIFVHVQRGQAVEFQVAPITTTEGGAYAIAATISRPDPRDCYPDCAHDVGAVPFLNVNDFICFQSLFAYALGTPETEQIFAYANCDQSTTPPVLNVNDFICFQRRFVMGCSAP